MQLYDAIGKGYAKTRLADARIVSGISENLGLAPSSTILGRETGSSFSQIKDGAEEVSELTRRAVRKIPFFLPRDLKDRFAAAGWGEPESYLSSAVRNGISSFALMDPKEVNEGISRLSADLASGVWDFRNGSLRTQELFDAGYYFIVAEKEANNSESGRR